MYVRLKRHVGKDLRWQIIPEGGSVSSRNTTAYDVQAIPAATIAERVFWSCYRLNCRTYLFYVFTKLALDVLIRKDHTTYIKLMHEGIFTCDPFILDRYKIFDLFIHFSLSNRLIKIDNPPYVESFLQSKPKVEDKTL